MIKRILSLILTLSMLLSLGAILSSCGGDTTSDEPEDTTNEAAGTPEDSLGEEQDSGADSESSADSEAESDSEPESESESESESEAESEEIYLEPDPIVEFISYNIAYYEGNSKNIEKVYEGQKVSDYTIEKRAARLDSLVGYYMPDVLALQEVNRLWWGYLITNEDSIVNKYGYEWAGNQGSLKSKNGKSTIDTDLYNILMWDPAKFEEVDSGVFRLDSTFYGEGNKDRQCTWAILRNKTTGTETLFASTHLCTRGNDSLKTLNTSQAKVLTEKIKAKADGRTIIMGGDFNANTSAPAYTHIIGTAQFSDTRTLARKNLTPGMSTMRTWGKTTNWKTGNNAIDHVFVYRKNYNVEVHQILSDTFDANNVISQDVNMVGKNYDLSDHLGVYVQFKEKGVK